MFFFFRFFLEFFLFRFFDSFSKLVDFKVVIFEIRVELIYCFLEIIDVLIILERFFLFGCRGIYYIFMYLFVFFLLNNRGEKVF